MPRSIREALTSWDRMLYDIPVITFPPGPGQYYKKQYDLGGADNYITEHCIDGVVFLPVPFPPPSPLLLIFPPSCASML